jgi:hypothetical protein
VCIFRKGAQGRVESGRRFSASRRSDSRIRRRRRGIVAGVAALSLSLIATATLETYSGADLARAAVQRAKSFVELMQQRSPGKRTRGQLAINKRKAPLRHERALPKVVAGVPILPPNLTPPLFDFVAPPLPMRMASLEAVPIGPLAFTGGPPPLFPFTGAPGILIPPNAPTVTPTGPNPPPVITPLAVPEPATWAMMILGFSLMGWQTRRARAERQVVAG